VLTLSLGIALVVTQFSLIDGLLLRPMPFADSERLFHIGRLQHNGLERGWQPVSLDEFLAHRAQQTTFDELAAFHGGNFNLSHAGGPPRRLDGIATTANFFELLRTRPQLGRGFGPGEDQPGSPLLVVLGHALWQEEFGSDPTVLGRAVKVNGEPGTVIGVMPAGFMFPDREECWVNLRLDPALSEGPVGISVELMGLLKPGIGPREAEADLAVIANRVAAATPDAARPALQMDVRRFQAAYAGSGTQTLLFTMLAMTGFVLALACVNVANLQLARAASRLREIAVRAALGADRGRILRQLLGESLLLATLGAVVGTLLALWGIHLLETQITNRVSVSWYVHFDLNARVLAFAVGVTAVAGLLAGLLPAWRASRLDLNAALKDDQRGSTGFGLGRFSRWLVTGQVAFAAALVVAASLLALSAVRSSRVNLAFNPDSLLIGRIELQGTAYEQPADRVRFYNQLVDRIQRTPGVAAAAVSSRDLVSNGVYANFEIDGVPYDRAQDRPGGWLEVVSRDYFQVVDRRAETGRLFGTTDTPASLPVALVNRAFAEKHWPGVSPIGRRIRRAEEGAAWATIVGVVPDLNMEGVGNNDPPAGWYLLQDQQAWGWLDLLVRTAGDPALLIPAVRHAVAEVDPEQPVHTITTLRERTARRLAGLEIVGTMAAVFAVTALVLAGVGIYGVMAFAVRRRTREFGVRLALGATGGKILTLLFRQGAVQTGIGVTAGLALGYALSRPLAPLLPKVSADDPALYVAVALVLTVVAALAIWLPARRAARVNPMVALRTE